MNTPIPYLDMVILASAAYPSGFSNSLHTSWRGGAPRGASTGFLWILMLPYAAIVLAVWAVRPELFSWRGPTVPLVIVAVALAPLALLIEYGIHALESYRVNGTFPRGIAVQAFWRRRLSPTDHLLVGTVAVGEEILYRGIWIGVLLSFGLPTLAAAGISSVAYGINHLAFGRTSVIAKMVTGLLYGSLYLVGGKSIWLPILSHCLQNTLLFFLTKERHA